jgi:hypothetical protein
MALFTVGADTMGKGSASHIARLLAITATGSLPQC